MTTPARPKRVHTATIRNSNNNYIKWFREHNNKRNENIKYLLVFAKWFPIVSSGLICSLFCSCSSPVLSEIFFIFHFFFPEHDAGNMHVHITCACVTNNIRTHVACTIYLTVEIVPQYLYYCIFVNQPSLVISKYSS